jgi:hypothetical protein
MPEATYTLARDSEMQKFVGPMNRAATPRPDGLDYRWTRSSGAAPEDELNHGWGCFELTDSELTEH